MRSPVVVARRGLTLRNRFERGMERTEIRSPKARFDRLLRGIPVLDGLGQQGVPSVGEDDALYTRVLLIASDF